MSNLNLDLIEKVRQQKAAVQYNSNVDNLNHLQALYEAIYPNNDIIILGNSNYYYTRYNGTGWSGEVCPINMEAIPLSAFFIEPNVTSEDKALIKETSDLLKQLKPLLNKVDKFITNECYQPIDTTEGEQEQGKEWKLEVGKFVWNSPNRALLGLIKEFSDHKNKVYVDLQNGTCEWWHTNILVKPTDKDIETWLVPIAEKKYPIGTIVWHGGMAKEVVISKHRFKLESENCFSVYVEGKLIPLWYNGKWAELAPIETEQRWKPKYEEEYWHIDFNVYGIIIKKSFNHGAAMNVTHIQTNNCFKTEQEAQKAAEAIKQYLSANKF